MNKVLKNQGYHLLGYVVIGTFLAATAGQFPERHNHFWGLSALEWIAVSWILAGVHQAYIAFLARLELYLGKIRAWFGSDGFPIFKVGFFLLSLTRLATVIPISLATVNTLPVPRSVSVALIVVTAPFILWTFYSFVFYFGIDRAACADHFDPAYRGGALEKMGIFRFLSNPGYSIGILIIYHAGLMWQSSLGLVAAAAHHAFVWCAYYSFERPDMKEIYGPNA